MNDLEKSFRKATDILARPSPALDDRLLADAVSAFNDRSGLFRGLCKQFGSPLYVIEEDVLVERAHRFIKSFRANSIDINAFYAVKCNNHPTIVRILVKAGMGLDVSSGDELRLALNCNAKRIIFSGPGKTIDELELAIAHRDRVTVLVDSFSELDRLASAASASGVTIRCGVRVCVDDRGLWRKFGIPLANLERFLVSASSLSSVRLSGIQFHTSWNMNPSNQTAFIARLGSVLKDIDTSLRSSIEFIDIGGGYWPEQGEWLQPSATPEGTIRTAIEGHGAPSLKHYAIPSVTIEQFAKEISLVFEKHILPHNKCAVYAEPGRWICHPCAHYLLTVIDRKADDIVITDGGTNAVGWERFESDYFPVINLSQPSLSEKLCYIFGSLCTPHDVWGYSYFGNDIAPGDVLLVPFQGAYTYSLRQRFIKPIPASVLLRTDGSHEVVSTD
jgi:diaminopimelate decarboxylase